MKPRNKYQKCGDRGHRRGWNRHLWKQRYRTLGENCPDKDGKLMPVAPCSTCGEWHGDTKKIGPDIRWYLHYDLRTIMVGLFAGNCDFARSFRVEIMILFFTIGLEWHKRW